MVYKKVETIWCVNEDLACEQILSCLQLGRFDEVIKLAEKYCKEIFRFCGLVFIKGLLENRHATMISMFQLKLMINFIFDILKYVLTKANVSRVGNLWLMVYILPYNFLFFLWIQTVVQLCLWIVSKPSLGAIVLLYSTKLLFA